MTLLGKLKDTFPVKYIHIYVYVTRHPHSSELLWYIAELIVGRMSDLSRFSDLSQVFRISALLYSRGRISMGSK